MPFTMNDVKTSVDSNGHPVYSLPNGDSVTSAGRVNVGQLDSNFDPSWTNVDGSQLAFITGNADSRVNAINQQALWNREDSLRERAEWREDHAIDILVDAAKRNGINPIFLLDAMNTSPGSAASYTTSATKNSNFEASERTTQANSASILGAVISAVAAVSSALALASAKKK